MKKIALLITGHIRKSVSADYDVLLMDGMDLPKEHFVIFDLPNGDLLTENDDFAGIVISGSSKMTTDEIPWLDETCEWLGKQAEKNIPILGICFGHQLLAIAFGGKVANNPMGIEVGTKLISLNKEGRKDPLFKYFYPSFLAQLSHVQSVIKLPLGAVVIANSEQDQNQIFRIRYNIWGVQFHPEFDADIIRMLIVSKAEKYPGKIEVDNLLNDVEETPKSYSVLKKFGEIALN